MGTGVVVSWGSEMLCAQRLAASKEWARLVGFVLVFAGRVLNALRHQRNGHDSREYAGLGAPGVLNALRHQRNGHPPAARGAQPARMCSTPCGIKGMGTAKYNGQGADRRCVLNALRHQRNGHIHRPDMQTNLVCVLNALRHQRNGHGRDRPRNWRACEGAQRLAASKEWARAAVKVPQMLIDVLNALRHQRNGHLLTGSFGARSTGCSTPCGIKGMGTANSDVGRRLSYYVLNALRHQRNGHG